jgi:hypothetical protein
MTEINATVVLEKCSKTKKLYGMRVEQRGRDWVRTWTFPIPTTGLKNNSSKNAGTRIAWFSR